MHAIPTVYRGVQFRSRLEARWAAFFDLLGWKWEYEPIDLPGWIPDFRLDTRPRPVAGLGAREFLVEIKPDRNTEDLRHHIPKLIRARAHMPILLLGGLPYLDKEESFPRWGYTLSPGAPTLGWDKIVSGSRPWFFCPQAVSLDLTETGVDRETAAIDALWIEAGNAVQWKAPR